MDFKVVRFLVIDDDQVSVMKIKRVLKKANLSNPVSVAQDGIEALELLRGSPESERLMQPYVVTLDINMPRMDGHEFLEEVRNDPSLRSVVIFVLTTSDNHSDVMAAYDKNIAGYILKENSENGLLEKINMIKDFTNLVVLPS